MRQFFLTFLLVVTAAVSLMFGGMAVMNHGVGMMMPGDNCMNGVCATTSQTGGMDGATCLSHCIQAATVNSIVPMSTSVQSLILFFVAILFASVFKAEPVSQFFRTDNAIGKLLLKRQLSTVIIRD